MKFETLEDRMNYYRGMTDYKLMPGSYVLIMLDGRSFQRRLRKHSVFHLMMTLLIL